MSPYTAIGVTKSRLLLPLMSLNMVDLSRRLRRASELQDQKNEKFAFANLAISRY